MEGRVLGCSRCRYSSTGCSRCKKPSFTHRGPRPLPTAQPLTHAKVAVDPSSGGLKRQVAETRRREQSRKRKSEQQQFDIDPQALIQAVSYELQQLEQLHKDVSANHHRKGRAHGSAYQFKTSAELPESHPAKRLRQALQAPAGAAAAAAGTSGLPPRHPQSNQQQQHDAAHAQQHPQPPQHNTDNVQHMHSQPGLRQLQDRVQQQQGHESAAAHASVPDAAVAGNAQDMAAAAGDQQADMLAATPNGASSSFAATLEIRIK